ncbi:hypothetical protein Ddc_06963 [Ditylenchus destructor]|nr:hypothetical protein Ddc_06963 [Ditylenchus destructor]
MSFDSPPRDKMGESIRCRIDKLSLFLFESRKGYKEIKMVFIFKLPDESEVPVPKNLVKYFSVLERIRKHWEREDKIDYGESENKYFYNISPCEEGTQYDPTESEVKAVVEFYRIFSENNNEPTPTKDLVNPLPQQESWAVKFFKDYPGIEEPRVRIFADGCGADDFSRNAIRFKVTRKNN